MISSSADRKPWALLAYTVADDKSGAGALDAAARNELKAICDAADFTQVSIAAQVDFKKTPGVYRGTISAATRGFKDVKAEEHPLWRKILAGVRQSVVKVQAEDTDLDAARASVLQQFLRYGQRQTPAERYVVFFYGHGYGPMGLFYDSAGRREPGTLRLGDLASSIGTVDGRAAVLLFRDCFVCTLESAFQFRGVAEFMVATQALAPIAGVWPWSTCLSALARDRGAAEIATSLASAIAAFLDTPANREPFADVPLSVVDLDQVATLRDPLKALAGALDAVRGDARLEPACARALEASRVGSPGDHDAPGDPALLDVSTMCERLQAVGHAAVAGPAKAVAAIVRDRLVTWQHAQQPRHKGISVYYKTTNPKDAERSYVEAGTEEDAARDAAAYRTLALCVETGWDRVALNPLKA